MDGLDQINQSSDVDYLSIKLKIVEGVIRNYLKQYHPNDIVGEHYTVMQKFSIQRFLSDYGNVALSLHSYRMIVTHSFEEIIRTAETRTIQAHKLTFLLPCLFIIYTLRIFSRSTVRTAALREMEEILNEPQLKLNDWLKQDVYLIRVP